jgi:hypothetical protein
MALAGLAFGDLALASVIGFRRRHATFPGGPIASKRAQTITIPSGRIVFRVYVGNTLTAGPYTKIVLWPTESPEVRGDLNDLLREQARLHPQVVEATASGEARVILPAGSYQFVAEWGALTSPIEELELSGGEELSIELRFDLGPQPPGSLLASSGLTAPEPATGKPSDETSFTISTVTKAISDLAKIVRP